MLQFVRNFIAVGQGMFTTEKFYEDHDLKFCIVYDCGTITKSVDLTKIIDEHFYDGEKDIDALFISHFDKDHISGIEYLISKCNVKNIYLPILSKDKKIILTIANSRNKKMLQFIADPKSYIKNIKKHNSREINVFYVKEYNDENSDVYENIERTELIESGKIINFEYASEFWEYIPYNVSYEQYSRLFKEINDICLGKKLNEVLHNKEIYKKLKDIYKNHVKQIKNDIGEDDNLLNINSLILYSGSKNINTSIEGVYKGFNRICSSKYRHCYHNCNCCIFENIYNKSGCIYFGDSDGKNKKVLSILTKHHNNLFCIQLPHHGSKYNNDAKIMKYDIYYIICAGVDNNYNHPSFKVIIDLLNYSHDFFIVNEYKSTEVLMLHYLSVN